MDQACLEFHAPTQEELEAMAAVDVRTVDAQTLVDIRDVHVNTELPVEERIQDYIRQIKNPYCFKCGKVIVKLRFAESGETLEERLTAYLRSL